MHGNTRFAICLVMMLGLQSCNQTTQFQSSHSPIKPPPQVIPVESADQLPPPIIKPGEMFQRLFFTTETDKVTDSFAADKKFSGITIPIRENMRQESVQVPVTEVHAENVLHQPSQKTETFSEKIQPHPLDLVVVVDDSSSMQPAIDKIRENLYTIVEQLGDTHWRMAVTTTSFMTKGTSHTHAQRTPCILGMLDRFDNGSVDDFKSIISRIGVNGHDDERGLERSIRAVGCNFERERWTRDNAMLGIVVVSDEDDCANKNQGCMARQNAIDYDMFVESLRLYSKQYYTSKFYALVAEPGEDATTNIRKIKDECFIKNPTYKPENPDPNERVRKIWFRPGKIYEQVVKDTDGIMACIWEDSYRDIFGRISTDLVSNVKKQFQLKYVPIREGLHVKVDGVDVTADVAISGQTIKFKHTPKVHQTVEVEYRYLSDDPLKEHQLANKPILKSVKIMLDDREMDKSEYTIDANGKIVFKTQISTGSKVAIDFKSIRKNIFAKINRKADLSSLAVSQNGQPFNGYTIDPATGLLTVDRAKIGKDLQPLVVSYAVSEGTVLYYPIDRTGLKGEFKGVFLDLEMQEKVEGATIQGDQIVFQEGTVQVDDSVQAMFEERTQQGDYPLTFLPVLGRSVSIKAPSHCDPGSVSVKGQRMVLGCKLGSDDRVEITYSKLVAKKTVFAFDQVEDPDNCTWEVTLVDSNKPVNFIREGNTVFVQDELPIDARIKIVARVKVDRPAE